MLKYIEKLEFIVNVESWFVDYFDLKIQRVN